jgi:hypothetical protein
MRGPEYPISWVVGLALSFLLLVPNHALAYVGPGPGLEFVPYFVSLLVWVGLALGAVLLWPFSTLLRYLHGRRRRTREAPEQPTSNAG